MRLIGRYFAVGATLGSVSGLVVLVLIWTWMTIHLGLLGFLIGWIPAGLAAAGVWLAMVVFWGPILVVGAMVSAELLLIRSHPGRDWSFRESPAASGPDEAPATTDADGASRQPEGETPITPTPASPPISSTDQPIAAAPLPGLAPPPPPARPFPSHVTPSDDLGGDAAAAGDTSRPRPK